MAQTTSAKKKSTKKRPAPAKRSKASKKPSRPAPTRSLRRAPETEDFFVFRLNRQTLYWLVLGIVVVTFGVWIYKLQSDIQSLYDQIDQTFVVEQSQPTAKKHR